jgi:hypothetical protein
VQLPILFQQQVPKLPCNICLAPLRTISQDVHRYSKHTAKSGLESYQQPPPILQHFASATHTEQAWAVRDAKSMFLFGC